MKFAFVLLVLLSIGSVSKAQSIIFDESYLGSELPSAPGITFPGGRSPSVSATSLVFGTNPGGSATLFHLPLISAGTISSSTIFTAIIDLNITIVTADTDLLVSVSDGTDDIGSYIVDNNSGTAYASVNAAFTSEIFRTAGFPSVNSPLAIETKICFSDSGSEVNVVFGSGSGTEPLMSTLNETAALDLVLTGGDASEEYQIDSIRIRIVEGTPVMGQLCAQVPVELQSYSIE